MTLGSVGCLPRWVAAPRTVVGLGPMIILTCGFDKCVAEKEEVGAMVVLSRGGGGGVSKGAVACAGTIGGGGGGG